MNYRVVIGLLTVAISIPSYWIYIRSVVQGKTRPHMYSWLIWSLLACIAFAGQASSNAGPGAWNTGVTAIACFLVFLLATRKGEKRLYVVDRVLLAVAGIAILVQIFADNHFISVFMATIAALVGFSLTFKKAYLNPEEENPLTFSLNSVRNFISLFALNSLSFLTFFYPFCMFLANASITTVIIVRRKYVADKHL